MRSKKQEAFTRFGSDLYLNRRVEIDFGPKKPRNLILISESEDHGSCGVTTDLFDRLFEVVASGGRGVPYNESFTDVVSVLTWLDIDTAFRDGRLIIQHTWVLGFIENNAAVSV